LGHPSVNPKLPQHLTEDVLRSLTPVSVCTDHEAMLAGCRVMIYSIYSAVTVAEPGGCKSLRRSGPHGAIEASNFATSMPFSMRAEHHEVVGIAYQPGLDGRVSFALASWHIVGVVNHLLQSVESHVHEEG
jgi:hypothetical protein